MIPTLAIRSLMRAKARFLCAVLGISMAAGAIVFSTSLVATNNAQAPAMAKRAARPWSEWRTARRKDAFPGAKIVLETVDLTVDFRPGGRVLQGPPMRVRLAEAPEANPYGAVALVEGVWVEQDAAEPQVVCVDAAMRRFGKIKPAVGEFVKFVGRKGTMTARIAGYLNGDRLPPQFPNVFANRAAFDALQAEERSAIAFFSEASGVLAPGEIFTPESDAVVAAFKSDEQRRMDYATPLMIIAAVLTALSLLVNSLLLSIEANKKTLAILRLNGMTRRGIVAFVAVEAFLMAFCGWALGCAAGMGAVKLFSLDAAAFPAGAAYDFTKMGCTLFAMPFVALLAIAFSLRSALKTRPIEALAERVKPARRGMAITFALGFAAFVAVETWGASLMRAFVPSPEWPDAIVSILPAGASSFDIEKLRGIEGVERISELLPLQVYLEEAPPSPPPEGKGGRGGRMPAKPNALFLAAEWLPRFKFAEGDYETACAGLKRGEIVISLMMSRARNLHAGDTLLGLKIAAVADVNWHMVTSRALVRGMNRMPVMTDGPCFASFDTVESLDRRPAFMVPMTHVCLDYKKEFLAKHGPFGAGRLVEKEIARRLGNRVDSTVRLHSRDEIADGTLAHGTDVIGAAARVPFVFLAILAIGFVAMLVAEADARNKEFRILRAVGATKGQIAWKLVASALRTAACGVACGVPAGVVCGYFASLKTAAIWPGLPHYLAIPWQIVAEGAIGAFVFALIFAIPSALARSSPRQ